MRGEEQSVLDYFLVCNDLYQNILKMTIDENRQYVLSRFYKYKTRTSTVESDHNILVLLLSFKWSQHMKKERKEIYNVRNISCQKIFSENTARNPQLVKSLQNTDIFKGGAKWIKQLNHLIATSFDKIRISNSRPNKKIMNLFKTRENLKLKISNSVDEITKSNDKRKLEAVEKEITDINAEENFRIIKEQVGHLVDNTENLNSIQMWKLKKKLFPLKSEQPVAKKNLSGELVTKPTKLKELYENTYKNRLSHRAMKPELLEMYKLKMNLFKMRLEVSKNVKTEKWTSENLLNVLKGLKKNKSADPNGLIYELFRPEIIGTDLFASLLMLCNNVKDQLLIPQFMTLTDITSIFKQKGEKSDLENYRGLFGTSKVRSIIEKLVIQDTNENKLRLKLCQAQV